MTVGLASGRANALLEAAVGTTSYTAPTLIALKLHTADPGAAGTTAAAAGDTTRKTVTFGAAASGVKSMTSMSGSWTNVSTTETITHISAWDSTSAGTFQYSGALTASQAWVNTNTLSITSHSVSFTPLAA